MWANAQRDGRPAEYRRRLLFNALYCLAHSSNVPYTAFSLQYITHPNLHSFSKAVIYGNTQFYLQTSHYMPLFPSRRASPPFGWHSLYHPTEDRRLSRPKLLNFMKIYQELFRYRHWRRQLWDTGAHVPLTSNNLFFAVHFTAVQSLTATLCGCLSKHIRILRQQLR